MPHIIKAIKRRRGNLTPPRSDILTSSYIRHVHRKEITEFWGRTNIEEPKKLFKMLEAVEEITTFVVKYPG